MRLRIIKLLLVLCLSLGGWHAASAQFYTVRANGLAALTGTIEIGGDIALTDNWSLDATLFCNPINTPSFSANFYAVQIGAKHWFYENYVGHFLGQQLIYVNYHLGNLRNRYDGNAYGIGLSYGYAWILSTRWSVAVEAGIGLYYTRDTHRDPTVGDWDDEYIYHNRRLTLAPSRLGVTFSYLF